MSYALLFDFVVAVVIVDRLWLLMNCDTDGIVRPLVRIKFASFR